MPCCAHGRAGQRARPRDADGVPRRARPKAPAASSSRASRASARRRSGARASPRREERGYRVLACRPAGSEAQLSFAALGDLLDDVLDDALADLPEPRRRALEVAFCSKIRGGARPTSGRRARRSSARSGPSLSTTPCWWRSTTRTGSTRRRPPCSSSRFADCDASLWARSSRSRTRVATLTSAPAARRTPAARSVRRGGDPSHRAFAARRRADRGPSSFACTRRAAATRSCARARPRGDTLDGSRAGGHAGRSFGSRARLAARRTCSELLLVVALLSIRRGRGSAPVVPDARPATLDAALAAELLEQPRRPDPLHARAPRRPRSRRRGETTEHARGLHRRLAEVETIRRRARGTSRSRPSGAGRRGRGRAGRGRAERARARRAERCRGAARARDRADAAGTRGRSSAAGRIAAAQAHFQLGRDRARERDPAGAARRAAARRRARGRPRPARDGTPRPRGGARARRARTATRSATTTSSAAASISCSARPGRCAGWSPRSRTAGSRSITRSARATAG